jgi:hypothetical protein
LRSVLAVGILTLRILFVSQSCATPSTVHLRRCLPISKRGLLKETLVVVATEFGRTPNINTNVGRDHHPQAFSCVMAGGGVKGGYVHGKTDKEGREIEDAEITVPDFTIASALGLPLKQVVLSSTQRPFTVAEQRQTDPPGFRIHALQMLASDTRNSPLRGAQRAASRSNLLRELSSYDSGLSGLQPTTAQIEHEHPQKDRSHWRD